MPERTHLPLIPKEKGSVAIKRVALYGLCTIHYLDACKGTVVKLRKQCTLKSSCRLAFVSKRGAWCPVAGVAHESTGQASDIESSTISCTVEPRERTGIERFYCTSCTTQTTTAPNFKVGIVKTLPNNLCHWTSERSDVQT